MKILKNVFLILLCLTAFNYSAKAEITPQEARDANYLQNHGHSKEMSRLIDLKDKQINGISTKKPKPHFYSWPVRFYTKCRNYVDPIYDNGDFGSHEISPNPHSLEDL
jgi:hypothetical protein